MSDIMKKCPKCGSDIVEGQKFCIECGIAQELKMRSKEEILEMRKRIFEIRPSQDSGFGPLVFSLTTLSAMDIILKWVLGLANDEKVLDMVKMKSRREKI
ncbi:hypothetical protein ES703_79847 [subsurface metagenome]